MVLLLLVCNLPLLHGRCNSALLFLPGAVQQGEWWRVLTHPFVHVTWFHLLLDGLAFVILYHDLKEQSWIRRMGYFIASGAGSLLVAIWADPTLSVKGLCGISGVAHGLMAVSALELMAQRQDKLLFRTGLSCFALVLIKCLIEGLTGKMIFAFLYFGLMGDPVAVTHAGGMLGGVVSWLLLRRGAAADRSHSSGSPGI